MNRKRSRGKLSRRQNTGEGLKRPPITDELWTDKEERLLYEAIEGPGDNKCWEDIIEGMQKEIPSFNHEPDDCMRYFKHYINPSWYSEQWPMDQGFFLSILYKVYGHDWEKLSELIQEKNPLVLKNYFFSFMHKAMRHASNNYVPWAMLDRPANFFEWIQMLDEVNARCFKGNTSEECKRTLEHAKKFQLDAKKLKDYRERVIKRFRETQGEEKIPIGLVVDLGIVNLRGREARALVKSAAVVSAGVKDVMTISFTTPEVEEKQRKEKKSFQFPVYRSMLPVYVFKQTIPEPVMYQNVPNYPSQIVFPPQVQTGVMMPPQEQSANQQRKNENPNEAQRKDLYK